MYYYYIYYYFIITLLLLIICSPEIRVYNLVASYTEGINLSILNSDGPLKIGAVEFKVGKKLHNLQYIVIIINNNIILSSYYYLFIFI